MRRAHTEKRSQYNERKKENDKRGEEGATREEDRRTLFGRAETNVETSGGVSTICVYTRPSRPLDVYIPFCRFLFVYLFSSYSASIFLRVFFLGFSLRLLPRFSTFRCTFVPTTLYHPAIISHTCYPLLLFLFLSFSLLLRSTLIPPPTALPLSLPPPRHYHPAFYKIYVCRRTSDVAAGYLFFQ